MAKIWATAIVDVWKVKGNSVIGDFGAPDNRCPFVGNLEAKPPCPKIGAEIAGKTECQGKIEHSRSMHGCGIYDLVRPFSREIFAVHFTGPARIAR